MSGQLSASAKLRQHGKAAYSRSFDKTVNGAMRLERARQAARLFGQARDAAVDASETALAASDRGWALQHASKLLAPLNGADERATARSYRLAHLEGALTALIEARHVVGAGKPNNWPHWRAKVINSSKAVFKVILETLLSFGNLDERARQIDRLIGQLKDQKGAESYMFVLHVNQADAYFKAGVCEVEVSRAACQFFPAAIRNFKECHYPLEEAKKLHRKLTTRSPLTGVLAEWTARMVELHDDVPVNLHTAEAFQAIRQGDQLLRAALEDSEELNMDGVFCAVDKLRVAGVICGDVELLATVYSRLGGVYLDVLKVEQRAHEYLLKCAELAESLMPRNFHGRDWFDSAMSKLAAIRKREQQREDEEKRKEREPYLEELKGELEQLRALMTLTAKEVLLQLPVKFPPKHKEVSGLPKSDGDLAADNREVTKKFLQRLIFHYHPDHVDKQQFGFKYFMLCEEITKLVTNMYYHYTC